MRGFKKAIQRVSRWSLAIALLPLLWTLVSQLAHMVDNVAAEGVKSWWRYLAGAGGYLLVERLVARPMWLYVVGHELTHAFSGLLSGAKIYSLRAGSHGGEVRLSKSNGFIALSPYVVPFYAIVVLGLYAAARKWWNPPAVFPSFQVLLGAALAFHFSLTFSALHGHQSDLKVLGFALSGVLIAIGNALILAVLAVSLFGRTPTLRAFTKETIRETSAIWMKGFKYCKTVNRFNPPQAKYTSKDRVAWTH